MNSTTRTWVMTSLLVCAGAELNAQINLAQGRPVVLNGSYGVIGNNCCGYSATPVAAASSLVDGEFLARSNNWQTNTVWWDGSNAGSASNTIELDLGSLQRVTGLIVQADDNDSYLLEYRDSNNSWVKLWDMIPVGGEGMQTRPTPASNSEIYSLPAAVETSRLRFTGVGGDAFYSVSEIQVFGVPEPLSMLSLLFAAALVGLQHRRSRRFAIAG